MFTPIVAGLLFALITALKATAYLETATTYAYFEGSSESYYLDSRKDPCVWQCRKLFAPDFYTRSLNTPAKDCSAEINDLDLTNCICDHLLIRTKFPQCYISICGHLDRWTIIEYLNDQVSFPEGMMGIAEIGLWTACAQKDLRQDLLFVNITVVFQTNFSVQALWPISPKQELSTILYARAGSNWFVSSLWVRKYLLPIWRQDNILSSLGYHPPPDSGNVENPRSPGDLLDYRTAFSVHLFATVAYAHLLHMVSESEGYWIETIQVIIFIIFPTLPTIQLLNSLLKITFKSAWPSGFRYNVSALCGQYIFERRDRSNYRARLIDISTHELETDKHGYWNGHFWGRIAAISVNLYLGTARFAAYVRRLRSVIPGEGHTAIYIAATGFDHRLGWVAFGGMVSTVLTLLRHTVNVEWSLNPNLHLPRRSNFDWKMEIWLEIIAAAIGQSMLMRLTNRSSTSTLRSRIFNLDSGRYITTASTFLVLIGIQYREPIMAAMRRRSSGLRRILLALFMLVSALYIVTVAFLQAFTDVEEIADIKLGWVFGWNYLWRVPEPNWLML
jgi:hypothetical protein